MSTGSFFESAAAEHERFANSPTLTGLARSHRAAALASYYAVRLLVEQPSRLHEIMADDWCDISDTCAQAVRLALAYRREHPGVEFHAADTAFAIIRERNSG